MKNTVTVKILKILLCCMLVLGTGCTSAPASTAVSPSASQSITAVPWVTVPPASPTVTSAKTQEPTPAVTVKPKTAFEPVPAKKGFPIYGEMPEDYALPYIVNVNRLQNTVAVYQLGGEKPMLVKAFACSVGIGEDTPTGTFFTTHKYVWRSLYGGTFGQYATRIVGSILFHSVPYERINKASLKYEEYNKLGTAASLGCVRMTVDACKWIYDNCPIGTCVVIYEDKKENLKTDPIEYIDPASPSRSWDPTDPDPCNPWRIA